MSTIVLIMSTKAENLQLSALFGKTRRRVLAALCASDAEPQFLRGIARVSGVSAGTVQRELISLVGSGIVIREAQGRQILYRINPNLSFAAELKSIFYKTTGIPDALRRALEPIRHKIKNAFIYGSYAAGSARPGSDVDVAVIGSASVAEVVAVFGPVQLDLGREINPTVFSAAEFKKGTASGNPFLARVWKGPKIFLIGGPNESGAMAE